MRGAILAARLAVILFVGPVWAQESPPLADGYAFDHPRLLTQQLIWGLVHGVRLLANRCREEGRPGGDTVAQAYAEWLERYRAPIAAAAADLSRHYSGHDGMSYPALTAALHLKAQIPLRNDELDPACGSFVAALASPRYDLDLFYRLHRDAARVERADAVRLRVAVCRRKLVADQVEALDRAFAGWVQANGLIEEVARAELIANKGDSDEDRRWRREAGAGAVPSAVACSRMAEMLSVPTYSLDNVFEEEHE